MSPDLSIGLTVPLTVAVGTSRFRASTTSTVLVVTDKTVQAGQTYFCEVTSVDSDALESAVDGRIGSEHNPR